MNRMVFSVIYKSDKMTKLARAVDIFEEGKICGLIQEINVDYKEDQVITWERVQKVRDFLATQDEVVFAHCESIQTDDSILFNTLHVKAYVADDVRVVSDGQKFFLLADFLKSKKISHSVTDKMYVRTK